MNIDKRYIVEKKLAETKSNIVYIVKDKKNNDRKILKLLKDSSEEAILQFKKEFSILHVLRHPNIVKVYEFNTFIDKNKERYYFTMEFIEGLNFKRYFEIKGFSNFPVLFKELLETILYIHKRGFIHGDLKPNHIIVSQDNNIKIVDFGFAQLRNKISQKDIGGTLEYIAPELLRGELSDERSDIYSIGIIGYESLSGIQPFKAKSVKDLIKLKFEKKINKNAFISVGIPGYLKDIIVKMTSTEPLNRFKDVSEIIEYIKNEGTAIQKVKTIENIFNYPFVGRKKFLNYTKKIINDSHGNRGHIIIFKGEEGEGKTAMLREIEFSFLGDDIRTSFIDFRNYMDNSPDWIIDIFKKTGISVKDLEIVLNKGEFDFSGLDKYKFYDLIVEKLMHLSQNGRHVFLIDNLKKDNLFVDFISYIANYLDKINAFFIFTTKELPDRLNSLIINNIFGNIALFKLRSLSKYDIKTIMANMLGVKGNLDDLVNYVYKTSLGIPKFVVENIKNIVNKGSLKEKQGNLIYDMEVVKKISLPSSIKEIYEKNLSILKENVRTLAEIIAVFKFPIEYNILIKLTDLPETEIVNALNSKEFHDFIAYGAGKLYYVNDQFREYVYESIPKDKRKAIHKRIVEILKDNRHSISLLKILSYNALYLKSRDVQAFLSELISLSSDKNQQRDTIEAFIKLYQYDKSYVFRHFDVNRMIEIGKMLMRAGNYKLSRKVLSDALKKTKSDDNKAQIMELFLIIKTITGEENNLEDEYNEILNLQLSADRRYKILLSFGWYYYSRKNTRKAKEIYEKAGKLLKKLSDKTLKGKLIYNMAVLKMSKGKYDDSLKYAEELVSFAKSQKSKQYLFAGMNLIANIFQYKRQYLLTAEHYKELLKLMEESVDINRKLRILINLSKMLFKIGELEESKSYYFRAIIEAKKSEHFEDIAVLYNIYGSILIKEGYWNDALDYLGKSLNLAREIGEEGIVKDNILAMIEIYGYRGNVREMDKLIAETEGIVGNVKSLRERVSVNLIFGTYHFINGNYKDAADYLNKVIDSVKRVFLPEYQVPALVLKGNIGFETGMFKQMEKSIERAIELEGKSGLFLYDKELKFLRLLLPGQTMENSDLKKEFERLLSEVKNNDKLLFIKVAMKYADFVKSNFPLTDRINAGKLVEILEYARILCEELGTDKYLIDIDNGIITLYKQMAEEKRGNEGYNYGEIISEFIDIMKNIEDTEKLKSSFINLAKKFTGAERGLFITYDAETGEFYPVGKDIDKDTVKDIKDISSSIVKRAVSSQEPVIVSDALVDNKFSRFESIKINRIHSILVVPVVSKKNVWGVLYLDSRKNIGIFNEDEKQLFLLLSILLARTLENSLTIKNIKEEAKILRENLRTKFGPEILIGKSAKMQEVYDCIEKYSQSDVPVLILGESGTGKEITAKNIHYLSARKDKDFLLVDCSSLSPSLIESELFGYKKGAFTGAKEDKIGHFEAAKGGTLFIDEISNASDSLQARLLRFLDTHEVKKIGTTKYTRVDTRIIVASNVELYELVKNGKFRSDLFFRLSRFVITLPPLRERKEDIKLLIDYFIDMFNKKYGKKIKGINDEAFNILYGYNWPGNVRELKNEIDKCVFFCDENYITPQYLSGDIKQEKEIFVPLREMKTSLIKRYIDSVLKFTNGDITKAAKLLDTDKATIYRYKKK